MIKAIIEKEIKELLKSKEFISYYIMIMLVMGILIPLSSKESLLSRNWYVMGFMFQIISVVIPSGLTADSFAGEKERKTIETLLFSPIELVHIFLAKVIYIVIVTLIIVTIVFGISFITIATMGFIESNRFSPDFYPFKAIYFIFAHSLITCFFTTFLGTVFSLKCKTVKAANLINYFVGLPIVAPVMAKLYEGDVSWIFLLLYELSIAIGTIVLLVIIKKRVKTHTVLENL